MIINVITAFPEFYSSFLKTSLVKKSIDKNIIGINIVDLKNYGVGRFNKIDDTQYGGGVGMVIKVNVVKKALESIQKKGTVIALTAKGSRHKQILAVKFSKLECITIISGRYEGFDERVFDYVDYKISIGEFITLGGEAPSLCLIESIIRLIPGTIGKIESTRKESWSPNIAHKHPVYTKPKVFEGKSVPSVLLSGNHEKIKKWRDTNFTTR